MKNAILLSILAVALTSTDAFAQGTVSFLNNSSTLVRLNPEAAAVLGLPDNAPVPAGTQFMVTLFYAPAEDMEGSPLPDPGDVGMMDVIESTGGFTTAGRFSNGVETTPSTTTPGHNAWFQVRAFESVFGSTYEQAVNAGPMNIGGTNRRAIAGKSNRFNMPTGTPPGSPNPITAGGLQPFTLGIQPGDPYLIINNIAVAEGTNGTVNAVFTVTLVISTNNTNTVSVDFATADSSAVSGQDYVATNGTLIFNPSETQKMISVVVTADPLPEPEEDFFINLSNPINAFLVRARGTCIITEVRIVALSVDVAVSFNTVLNRNYVVEKTQDFSTWIAVLGAENVPGNGGDVTITDHGGGCNATQIYRARLLP